MPLTGVKSLNVPTLTIAERIDLVDFTGRNGMAEKVGGLNRRSQRH